MDAEGMFADDGSVRPDVLPVLPYAGTSGHSGSETSRERAERQDTDGTTSDRQRRILAWLDERGAHGATWKEVAERYGWHHGQASGALSGLHKEGHIARLATERRDRCAVYVLPQDVRDRETAPHGRQQTDKDREIERLRDLLFEVRQEAGHALSADTARSIDWVLDGTTPKD